MGTVLGAALAAFAAGMLVGEIRQQRADARRLARLRDEADECWAYACRLLEEPGFYREEMETLGAVQAPIYGWYGRIVETAGGVE